MDRLSLFRSILARTSDRTDSSDERTPLFRRPMVHFQWGGGGFNMVPGTTQPLASSLIREMTSIWRRLTTLSSTASSVGNDAFCAVEASCVQSAMLIFCRTINLLHDLPARSLHQPRM